CSTAPAPTNRPGRRCGRPSSVISPGTLTSRRRRRRPPWPRSWPSAAGWRPPGSSTRSPGPRWPTTRVSWPWPAPSIRSGRRSSTMPDVEPVAVESAPRGDRSPREAVLAVRGEVAKVVVGQDGALSGIVAAMLARGHVLLEGVPGVAKTLLVKAVAAAFDLDVARVQFTPDLMPSDVTGQLILDSEGGGFRFREGPVFTNVLLADEINRTPPKTQAALLESMEERQVTVEGRTRPLPEPFTVVATQNPIEYEGTYPLPEAQLDRFLFKIDMSYPTAEQEQEALARHDRRRDPHD